MPRICFHCQLYGHTSKTFQRQKKGLPELCICGVAVHDGAPSGDPVCINHNPNSKICEMLAVEKDISLRAWEHISYTEACEQVNAARTRKIPRSGVN